MKARSRARGNFSGVSGPTFGPLSHWMSRVIIRTAGNDRGKDNRILYTQKLPENADVDSQATKRKTDRVLLRAKEIGLNVSAELYWILLHQIRT